MAHEKKQQNENGPVGSKFSVPVDAPQETSDAVFHTYRQTRTVHRPKNAENRTAQTACLTKILLQKNAPE
jgi:hypothetical protein